MNEPGTGGFRESVNFCFGEYVFAGTSGHTASMTIGGGGPCVQVEQFPRREGAIGVVPARARVTRLGCCDDPDGAVTITASGDTFRSQTFATNFSLERAPAATASQPANCVDTTLTIDDSQNHANIVQADGTDTTTLTVSLSEEPADPVNRYLEADFGMVPSSVTLSSDSATTTYIAGTHPEGSMSTTTAATVKVLRASGGQQSLDEVTVFNYDGFDFTQLKHRPANPDETPTPIADDEMIVSIPTDWTDSQVELNVLGDAAEIQTFLQQRNSFLANFYFSTHTKEGFYDGDGGTAGEWDPGIDTVYEAPSGQNSAGDATRGNADFDDCTGTVVEGNRRCGETISASTLIARLASCTNAVDANFGTSSFDCTRRSHRVTPKNMLVTLQKEHSLVAETGHPATTELNDAMGCNERTLTTQNFFDQIGCGADTFVRRYTETHFGGRPLNFPFFFRLSDGLFHGGIIPYTEGGDPVAFSVQNRLTYVQYRYTNWIQSEPTGGGVYLYYELWNEARFNYPWRD